MPFPLDDDEVPEEVEGGSCCCLAMVETALRKSGEFIEIPGTNEYGRRRTVDERTGMSESSVSATVSKNEYHSYLVQYPWVLPGWSLIPEREHKRDE